MKLLSDRGFLIYVFDTYIYILKNIYERLPFHSKVLATKTLYIRVEEGTW